MNTDQKCLECFRLQAEKTVKLATDSPVLHRQILQQTNTLIDSFDLSLSPPVNAVALYRLIAAETGCEDPFAALKLKSNQAILGRRDHVSKQITSSQDPLLAAIKFAVCGNVIDYGSQHKLNIDNLLCRCLEHTFSVNHYEMFRHDLEKATNILYLADNCGEIALDSLLIEQFSGKKIVLAVKKKPVLNDALTADAVACGLEKTCRIITNGTDCPGTPLQDCSMEFKDLFRQADLIISKGQGNFETLSDSFGPIYFMLMAKCSVVCSHLMQHADKAIFPGDLILMRNIYFSSG